MENCPPESGREPAGRVLISCLKRKWSDEGIAQTGKFACRRYERSAAACNYRNFIKSGSPRRVMLHVNGGWTDFPRSETRVIVEAFESRRSVVRMVRDGVEFVFDFVSMVLSNTRNGRRASVAWIDENDKCFFPAFFIGGDNSMSNGSETLDVGFGMGADANSQESATQVQVVSKNDDVSSSEKSPFADILQSKVMKLEKGSEKFVSVMEEFLSGMGTFADPSSIAEIYEVSPKPGTSLARSETYERQIQTTITLRGDANIQNGWFGTSKKGLFEILTRGFCEGTTPSQGAYGTGVYFATGNRSFSCASHCDVDEKGLQYMLLCQVVMGKAEQVPTGSKQHLPSKPEFDCGLDDLLSPKRYVVWENLLGTNISLGYIVCFKLAPVVREYLSKLAHLESPATVTIQNKQSSATCYPVVGGAQFEHAPSSPWASFSSVFQMIGGEIPTVAKDLLSLHYQEYMQRKISRADLIWRMRVIVGDKLLISALHRLQNNPSSYPNENRSVCTSAEDHP